MEEELFIQIGEDLSQNKLSSMFGVPCFKIGRKPYIMFHQNEIVCKLFDEQHGEALRLEGASLFNPMELSKPMGNWVQIPFIHSSKWNYFATCAYGFVEA